MRLAFQFTICTTLIVLLVSIGTCSANTAEIKARCGVNAVFNPVNYQCTECPENSVASIDNKCECLSGFALTFLDGAPFCVNCGIQNKVVSPLPGKNGSYFCVSCGDGSSDSNIYYEPESMMCECASDDLTLVQEINGFPLASQVCVSCSTPDCTVCEYPYEISKDTNTCVCVDGYTLLDNGSCVLSLVVEEMVNEAVETSMNYNPPNVVGGQPTTRIDFSYSFTRIVMSAAACHEGNEKECQFLSNMCVLMSYEKETTPCALYLYLKRKGVCIDSQCQQTEGLPWLYYLNSGVNFVGNTMKVKSWEALRFVVSVYDVSGEWLGMKYLVDELNQCQLPNTEAQSFISTGGTLEKECELNWLWFLKADPTKFYEIFVINPQNSSDLVPVPVYLDFEKQRFAPSSVTDPFFFSKEWSIFDKSSPFYAPRSGYRRRFYVYENIAAVKTSEGYPFVVTAAHSVSLVMGSTLGAGPTYPIFVIQYTSKITSELSQKPSGITGELPLANRYSTNTVKASMQSFFLPYSVSMHTALLVAVLVAIGICILTSFIRAYGYTVRRQNMAFDVRALLVWVMYFFDHVSNWFFLITAFTCWTLLVIYKFQYWLVFPLDVDEKPIFVLLIVSVATKGVVVAYRVVEQCNADFYIIDWERSHGQLLRESAVAPVSMWRANFLANQLNKLQSMRGLHTLFVMIIVSFFLLGLNYSFISIGVPVFSRNVTHDAVPITALCIAVDTFFWCAVSLSLYVLEFHVYYRFISVHPIQAFVDLCSVSNISVLILLEPMWGYYIHGRTIHAHADVNIRDFQRNLAIEKEGNLPVRGLGGQSKCQTFEVFLGPYMRQYLYMCQMEIVFQQQKDGAVRSASNPGAWKLLRLGGKRKQKTYSVELMTIRDQINQALQKCVHRAEGALFSKKTFHRLFSIPPNVMYMNGAQCGDAGSKDLFFFDKDMSFERCFFLHIDFDLFIFYTGLFTTLNATIHNVLVAMLITYLCEVVVYMYRTKEGKKNFCSKTLISECFV